MPRPETAQFGARPDAQLDFARFASVATILERGGFTAFVIGDAVSIRDDQRGQSDHAGRTEFFEPFTLTGALSAVTERIGLVATADATDNEPYTIARKLASLDHLSRGRAGWNIVTNDVPVEAIGGQPRSEAERYERAAEFVDIVTGLWDSYADDAMIRDKKSGVYFRRDGRQRLDHRGTHFRVDGPLNISRPPQGHPVIVQHAASGAGRAFAARYGEVLLTAPPTLDAAVLERREVDEALTEVGRDPGDVRVWPRLTVTGSPATIADRIETWFASGAIDGFLLSFSSLPDQADRFVDQVLPLLEARGIFVPATGSTLRESLGLARPAGRVLSS